MHLHYNWLVLFAFFGDHYYYVWVTDKSLYAAITRLILFEAVIFFSFLLNAAETQTAKKEV